MAGCSGGQAMDQKWCEETLRFLVSLESAHAALAKAMDAQRTAILAYEPEQLTRAIESTQASADQLHGLKHWRSRLLLAAGNPAPQTLKQALEKLPDVVRRRFEAPIAAAERQIQESRMSAWVVWILGNRGQAYCGEYLDLLAAGGKVDPGYSERPRPIGSGGLLLDASV